MAISGRGLVLGTLMLAGAFCLASVGCQSSRNVFKPPPQMPAPPVSAAGQQGHDPLGLPATPPCQCQPVQQTGHETVRGAPGDIQPGIVEGPATPLPPPGVPGQAEKTITCPVPPPAPPEVTARLPTELQKVTLPAYVIEPPDILLLDAVRLLPKQPYRLQPLDALAINVTETFPDQPIAGAYVVTPEGTVVLGFNYGSVRVVGLTVAEIEETLKKHLGRILKTPQVSVSLGAIRAIQQTRGEHLVHPDGTVHLGVYGCLNVTGMTLSQAKCAIEKHLSQFLEDPEITLDILAYNSKGYYVIADGGGFGQQVFKFPITGNDTVLDALERINGLPQVASRGRVWVARPSPCGHGCNQILPVDWQAIVQGGSTCTNYQLFPGDRVFIRADTLIRIDNALAKVIAPIERILGVTLLGTSVISSFRNNGNNSGTGFGFVTSF